MIKRMIDFSKEESSHHLSILDDLDSLSDYSLICNNVVIIKYCEYYNE